MTCTMCDFRKKHSNRESIPLMNVSGSMIQNSEVHQELDFVTGKIELEKGSLFKQYNVVITVAGAEPNGDITICTTAKFPTKTCPNCGKPL